MNLVDWIFCIIIITEFIVGNFANVFIPVVNFIDWIKRRNVSSVNWILTALSISRIGLLWAVLLGWHSSVFTADPYSDQIRASSRIVWALSNHFNNWLGTTLSIFYLFKIANFSNLLFLHLKRKIENVLLMMLLGTLLFLVANLGVVNKIPWLSRYEGNVTWKTKLKDITSLSNITLFSLINLIPFSISLICVLLLIYSLFTHLKNMKSHSKGCQDPSTVVHMKALQTVVSFVFLYAIYSLSVILSGWSSNGLFYVPIFLASIAAGAIYPTCHSCILIWGNQRLKRVFLLVLWQVRCWLKERKP